MKRTQLIAATLLAMLSGAQAFSAPDKSSIANTVRAEEKSYFHKMATEDVQGFREFDHLLATEKKLMRIKVNGHTYVPASTYIAENLTNKYEVRMIYADDTIHTMEGLGFDEVPWHSGQKLQAEVEFPTSAIERLDFYTGSPGEMHQNGYKNIKKIPYDAATGSLDFHPVTEKYPTLLFAILKVKGDKLFRKFIFVINPTAH